MAAKAAGTRPTAAGTRPTAAGTRPMVAHPPPNSGNPHSRPHSGIPTSGQQDPGLQGTSQDPGPSSLRQHHVPPRPVLYVPAPPPPPFLHYQWPMPFSYNPFLGFSSMGYGMVMPPFPPPHYMEAPTYILPHPHIQPVDYRRLLQPQVHAPSAPYQNPNQTRRIRLPHTGPRETVNSQVQTEATQRVVGGYGQGSPLVNPDSGHGTTSNSPSSSSSSSQRQGSAEVENYTLPSSNAKDLQVNRTCTSTAVKHGFNNPHPTETKTVISCIRATRETQNIKDGALTVSARGNSLLTNTMWSVSSPDSMIPVCSSSQQEDDVVKERRSSDPDSLTSWGGGTPQAKMLKMGDKVQNDHQLQSYETEMEHEKSVYQSPTETKKGPVVADANDDAEGILSSKDGESLSKILKLRGAYDARKAESRENEPGGLVGSVRHCLPYSENSLHSLSEAQKLPDSERGNGNETNSHEDISEIIPHQISLNSGQMKRKMNESVWSVESLAPFIPTKEWLLQNSMFEPEVIVEMTEEAENGNLSTQNDALIVKASKARTQTCRFSSSDSVPMSDSCLLFSTPAEKGSPSKKLEMESENASEMRGPKQGQHMAPSEKDPLASPTHLPSTIILSNSTEEAVDENGSSEPEASQSPNQECLIVNEVQEKSPCSPEQQEALLLKSAAGEKSSSVCQLMPQNGVDMEEGTCGKDDFSQLRNEQLCVPMADQKMADMSPSKGHLVDCGVQCTELKELKCACEELKSSMGPSRKQPKYSDLKKANPCKAEGFYVNGHQQKNQKRHYQWRNRGQEKQSGQQEDCSGYNGKPGKSKGGNGRNQRY